MPGFTQRELPQLFELLDMFAFVRRQERKRVHHIAFIPYLWLAAANLALEEYRTTEGDKEFYALLGGLCAELVRTVEGDDVADYFMEVIEAVIIEQYLTH